MPGESTPTVLRLPGFDLDVRPGTVADVPLLLSFIRDMAAFEKLTVTATEANLRDALFGERPAAFTLFAFVDGRPAAYAVYFFAFSTMVGKPTLWLEDLYVHPGFRRRGIARALLAHLAGLAARNGCGRLEWVVLDWNRGAIDFYRELGASLLDEWRICRLDAAGIERLAGQGAAPPAAP